MSRYTSETFEREQRALTLAGGNRLRSALLLDRWANVLEACDYGLSRSLRAAATRIVREESRLAPLQGAMRKGSRFWYYKSNGRNRDVLACKRAARMKRGVT